MKISGAAFKLTNNDLLSIINDFVKLPGFTIDKFGIHKYFYIAGTYKKFVKIPFRIAIFLEEVGQNRLVFQLKEVNVLICPIFKWVRNFILKRFLQDIKSSGIEYLKGRIIVDLNVILKNLPIGLSFKFKEIEIRENLLLIETKDIGIELEGKALETENRIEKLDENSEPCKKENKEDINKDKYSIGRRKFESKIPKKYRVFFPYMMLLPDLLALFVRIYKDDRVSWKVKAKCGAIITYLSSPVDIVFDFIPILGQMDDLAMAFLVLNTIICEVSEDIVRENWEGDEDIIIIVRRVFTFIHRYIGETNLVKLIRRIKYIFEYSGDIRKSQGEK